MGQNSEIHSLFIIYTSIQLNFIVFMYFPYLKNFRIQKQPKIIQQFKFSSVQSLSHVRLFVTPWTAAHRVSLSITSSWSLLKLMSIASVMPSNHLLLCHSLLFLPSIFPSIKVFSSESVLCNQVAKVLELQLQHQSFQ